MINCNGIEQLWPFHSYLQRKCYLSQEQLVLFLSYTLCLNIQPYFSFVPCQSALADSGLFSPSLLNVCYDTFVPFNFTGPGNHIQYFWVMTILGVFLYRNYFSLFPIFMYFISLLYKKDKSGLISSYLFYHVRQNKYYLLYTRAK